MKYIITYQQQSKNICFKELKSLNANFKEICKLENEQSLVQINLPQTELANLIKQKPLVFIRHIFAVNFEYKKPASYTQIASDVVNMLNVNKSFSVQVMKNIATKNSSISPTCLAEEIGSNFELNVKSPQQIVSVYETENNIYIGVGNPEVNLSGFKGGMPHFSKKMNFVSRAEYKLLEALDICKINLSTLKFGADLGSAPGGWTKVLANNNILTHSIDPASLSPDVNGLQNVKHFRMTTEQYLQKYNYCNLDIIVNDMKMDIFLSTQITLNFYDRLANNGFVVMTLKLPKNFKYFHIQKCIDMLKQKYTLLLARQLFHNRSEITLVLQKII